MSVKYDVFDLSDVIVPPLDLNDESKNGPKIVFSDYHEIAYVRTDVIAEVVKSKIKEQQQ